MERALSFGSWRNKVFESCSLSRTSSLSPNPSGNSEPGMDIKYSLKNIPIANKRSIMTNLFDKATNFINRMRWAAYWFDNSDETPNDKHAYKKGISNIFPSRRSAPECDKLIPFEEALFRLIRSITFRKINNELQKQMKRDINTIMFLKFWLVYFKFYLPCFIVSLF